MKIELHIGAAVIPLTAATYRALRAHLRDCAIGQLRALALLLPKIEVPR